MSVNTVRGDCERNVHFVPGADIVINSSRRQPDSLVLQRFNHFKFFCDQLHIFRKMTFAGKKSLMLISPVLKA